MHPKETPPSLAREHAKHDAAHAIERIQAKPCEDLTPADNALEALCWRVLAEAREQDRARAYLVQRGQLRGIDKAIRAVRAWAEDQHDPTSAGDLSRLVETLEAEREQIARHVEDLEEAD